MPEYEKKPNSCVGDVDELQIECWSCSHNWIIFRFAAEKEMSAMCPQCGMWNKRALRQALADTEIIEHYLNSPQFKKQHVPIRDLVGLTLNGSENLAEVKVALGIKEACDERG